MKKLWRFLISIVILLVGVSFLFFYKGENKTTEFEEFIKREGLTSYSIGNIIGDGEEYLVGLIEEDVVIYLLGGVITEVYRKDFSHLQPWKIAIGDVDGDGIDEISIGVYKESPLHPIMAKRPFIYSFIDAKLQPKWRGSRLARPFVDYNFYDLDGDGIEELISIEILKDDKRLINSYKWKGFGFEGYIESMEFEDINNLIIKEDGVYVQIVEKKDSYLGLLKLEGLNLKIERMD